MVTGKPARTAAFLVSGAAASALLADFGRFHRIHQGDTVLSTLISLYHWTPFYWDQNRFGMLIPLLAIPFRNPFWNLIFQCGVSLFAGLGALMLLVRYVATDSNWPLAALIAALAVFAAGPHSPLFQAFWPDQVYAPGLATLLLGLLLLSPSSALQDRRLSLARRSAGVALIAIAYWVNMATPFLAIPLMLLRRAFVERRSDPGGKQDPFFDRHLISLIALFASLALAYWAFARLGPNPSTSLNPLPLGRWPHAWWALARQGWDVWSSTPPSAALLAPALVGAALIAVPSWREQASRGLRAAAALIYCAVIYFFEVSASRWVQTNLFAVRYVYPSFMMFHAALAILSAVAAAALLGRRAEPVVRLGSLPLLCGGALWAFGAPSVARVRADLDETLGQRTPDVLEARCTHLAGDPWTVWPTVFHANWKLYEAGEHAVIVGVSEHSGSLLAARPPGPPEQLRVCVPIGDKDAEEAQMYLLRYSFPKLESGGRHGTIEVFVAAANR